MFKVKSQFETWIEKEIRAVLRKMDKDDPIRLLMIQSTDSPTASVEAPLIRKRTDGSLVK